MKTAAKAFFPGVVCVVATMGIGIASDASAAMTQAQAEQKIRFTIDPTVRHDLKSMQWTFRASKDGRPVLSGNRYRMENVVTGRGLKQQRRTAGINLGWLKKKSGAFNILVRRKAGRGELRYGDVVALHVKDQGWIRYGKRKWGINLKSHGKSKFKATDYQWQVVGGQRGARVKAGMPFALKNTSIRTYVTYCKRTYGINLGWKGKSKCNGLGGKLTTKLFGEGGLWATDDGLSGAAYAKMGKYLCSAGVAAGSKAVLAASGGAAAPALKYATPAAIAYCLKKL